MLTVSAGAFAQQQNPADTVYLFSQNARQLQEAQQNAAALITTQYNDVSTLSLAYNLQNGHFRTSQTAEKGREASFKSSGISTLGRFKVAGYFNFVRTWQDSLAWTMQGYTDEATPYYFAAGKAGKYDRLNYNFGGLVSYSLIKDKLYLAAGVTYLYNTASRSVDPRPSVQTFQLNITPQILYKTGKQVFGAALNLGYGKEQNNVAYRNLDYAGQSQTYADRINYLVIGYGLTTPYGAGSFRRKNDVSGFGLNYAYNGSNAYLSTALNYTHNYQDNFISLDASKERNRYGILRLNNYSGKILTGVKRGNYHHQLQASALWQKGYDNNYYEVAGLSNYKYSHQNVNVSYSVLKASASAQKTELGLNFIYDNVSKRDIGSSISSTFGYVQPGLNGTIYSSFKNNSRLALSLSPGVRLPVGNEVKVPVTTNVFANNIIYPDLTYWSSTAGVLGFNARYITPHILKNVNSGISFNANYINALSLGTNYQTGKFIPGKQRIDLTLSFDMYF